MIKISVIALLFYCTLAFGQDNTRKQIPSKNERKRFEVLVFLGSECPISQDYIGVLNRLHSQYGQSGSIRGVIPEKLNKKAMMSFRKNYQVVFPMEPDPNLSLVKKFSITTTPEVILLDPTGIMVYRGAIDNWYYELGRHRPNPTDHYLINAIEDMLKGKDVVVKETTPVGCMLSKHH